MDYRKIIFRKTSNQRATTTNIRSVSSECSRRRVKVRQITVPPPAPLRGQVIDIIVALKESMKTIERGGKKPDQKKRPSRRSG
jgi:hypothetical protein